MPFYDYRPTTDQSCPHCREGFEARQRMEEAPLESCPECGAPVARAITPFTVGKGDILSSSNLKRHGFTRLSRKDPGVYEKD